MAYFTIKLYAESLKRRTSFEMLIPNDIPADGVYGKRGMRTLFLLHGYTGDAWNWVPEYLTQKYNFAVVLPNGENAFWLDGISAGHKFCTFIGEELVGYIRKTFGLAESAEDTYIMGLSMGGFGALRGMRTTRRILSTTASASAIWTRFWKAKTIPRCW